MAIPIIETLDSLQTLLCAGILPTQHVHTALFDLGDATVNELPGQAIIHSVRWRTEEVRNARMAVDTVHTVQLVFNLLTKVRWEARLHIDVLNDLPIGADLAHVGNSLLERVVGIEPDLVFDVPVDAAS